MDINVLKLEKGVALAVCVGVIGFAGYLTYVLFFTGPKPNPNPTITSVNINVFGTKVKTAAKALTDNSQKVLLKEKDLLFMTTTLYKSFSDLPLDVKPSDSRGRPDPFVPYASP